jgi:5-deoxy-glucuronate isomerase
VLIRQDRPFNKGYNVITSLDKRDNKTMMDFGILIMDKNQDYTDSEEKERAFLLISGEITLKWGNSCKTVKRDSFLEENPWCLHVPANETVEISALSDNVEISVSKTHNGGKFASKLYSQEECRCEEFGKGTLGETSTRIVRTIFDYSNAPYANLVVGEVINYPGKWSSFPPHYHPQPEIYFYKFYPEQGFGYSEYGDEVFKARNNDVAIFSEELTHSQVAAPGYAMYYVWVIRHLENNPFNERIFVPEHKWLLSKDAVIWPAK